MDRNDTTTLLRLEHVRRDRNNSREAASSIIPDLTIEIARGEFTAITGPSGSGKSTLLHMMGGLERPTSGRIVFDGEEISSFSEDRLCGIRNLRIGFIYRSHFLLPEFTALENVMMPMLVAGTGRAEARVRARQLLERVGLGARLQSRPGQLSGGEQQRVAVARALANRPLLLLGDEPAGSLDSQSSRHLFDLLEELSAEGETIVYATHDAELAARARRCVRLVDGAIASDMRAGQSLPRTTRPDVQGECAE
ncbi:MAG TPA: ABC transporter ATP-binding protein [Candidatus Kapabacteria bacterium]|nr:ABC transporter ATP-binding protein [Candidatus Kapabacteria bacterium]